MSEKQHGLDVVLARRVEIGVVLTVPSPFVTDAAGYAVAAIEKPVVHQRGTVPLNPVGAAGSIGLIGSASGRLVFRLDWTADWSSALIRPFPSTS